MDGGNTFTEKNLIPLINFSNFRAVVGLGATVVIGELVDLVCALVTCPRVDRVP